MAMWVSPRTRSMLGTIGARLGVSRASILAVDMAGEFLIKGQWLQKMGKNPNAVQISSVPGTPFLQKPNQLEPCILLVCPLGLKASRSCVALPPNNRWSHCRWCRALRARKPLRRCSQCQLQVSTWFRWKADLGCRSSLQSSFQIARYWKNMWKVIQVIPITGFIYRFSGKFRKSTNIHLWSSNMARTSLVIGEGWNRGPLDVADKTVYRAHKTSIYNMSYHHKLVAVWSSSAESVLMGKSSSEWMMISICDHRGRYKYLHTTR